MSSRWPTAKLGDLCEIQRGGSPRPIDDYITDFPDGINWIKIGDVGEGEKYIWSTKQKIRPEGVQRSRFVEVGDFLLTNSMSFGRPYILRTSGCIHDGWLVLRYDKERLSEDYLYRVLSSDAVYTQFVKMASGAVVKNLNSEVVKAVEILLPPLPEQRRIAAILDKADALRTQRREALAQLDRLAQAIFVEMFGDPTSTSLIFSTVPLIELAQGGLQNGAYFPKEMYSPNGIEMVHMSDAFGGVVKRGNLRRVACGDDDISKYELNEKDLLIARRSLTYEGAAKPCRIPASDEPLLFESSFIRIRPELSKVSTLFLFHYFNSERVREKFVRPFVSQSTISGINQSNLARVPVIVPPIDLQLKFERTMASVDETVQVHQRASIALDGLFAAAQHRAFRGEL